MNKIKKNYKNYKEHMFQLVAILNPFVLSVIKFYTITAVLNNVAKSTVLLTKNNCNIKFYNVRKHPPPEYVVFV